MGVFTNESENTSLIGPTRLFKAFVLDGDNLVPKVVPQAIKKVEKISGNGGAGTVKKIHFADGSPFKYMVHQIDVVDAEKLTYKYTLIEGDVLGDVLEKVTYDTKVVATPDGGSIVKSIINTYYIKGDNVINDDQIKKGQDEVSGLFKAVEAYLLANPDA